MITGITDIGEIVEKSENNFLKGLVRIIYKKPKKEGDRIYAVLFDVKDKTVKLAPPVEYSDELCYKYLYIGNVTGQGAKIRLTVTGDALKYLFDSKAIDDILQRADPNSDFYKVLKENKDALTSFDYSKILSENGLNKNNVALYTIILNDKLVSEYPGYKKMLEDSFFENMKFTNGVCHLCGERGKVTSNTTKIDTKIYITDKINFAPYMDSRQFSKSFSICLDCYKKFLIGETFIRNYLKTRFLGFDTYIIPSFLLKPENISVEQLRRLHSLIDSSGSLKSYNNLRGELIYWREMADKKNSFTINLLIHKREKSAFKIIKLIKDVPPGRFEQILEAQREVTMKMTEPFGLEQKWYNAFFDNLFGILPIKQGKNEHILALKKVLNLIGDILEDKTIIIDNLIRDFAEFDRAVYYKSSVYNNTNRRLEDVVYNQLIFYTLLKKLNQEKRGETVNEKEKEEQKEALKNLGFLIAQIGAKQCVNRANCKKPILDKINFQGIPSEMLPQLVNEVVEKAVQYDILKWEAVDNAADMFKVFDKTNKWLLSPQENVFWILAGYSIKTQEIIHYKSSNKNKEEASKEPENITDKNN